MAMTRVIDVLHVLLRPPDEDSDGEVLQRFLTQRDEAAFAELVRRPESDVSRCCVRLIPKLGMIPEMGGWVSGGIIHY